MAFSLTEPASNGNLLVRVVGKVKGIKKGQLFSSPLFPILLVIFITFGSLLFSMLPQESTSTKSPLQAMNGTWNILSSTDTNVTTGESTTTDNLGTMTYTLQNDAVHMQYEISGRIHAAASFKLGYEAAPSKSAWYTFIRHNCLHIFQMPWGKPQTAWEHTEKCVEADGLLRASYSSPTMTSMFVMKKLRD